MAGIVPNRQTQGGGFMVHPRVVYPAEMNLSATNCPEHRKECALRVSRQLRCPVLVYYRGQFDGEFCAENIDMMSGANGV